jgi:hypothetical protein
VLAPGGGARAAGRAGGVVGPPFAILACNRRGRSRRIDLATEHPARFDLHSGAAADRRAREVPLPARIEPDRSRVHAGAAAIAPPAHRANSFAWASAPISTRWIARHSARLKCTPSIACCDQDS